MCTWFSTLLLGSGRAEKSLGEVSDDEIDGIDEDVGADIVLTATILISEI